MSVIKTAIADVFSHYANIYTRERRIRTLAGGCFAWRCFKSSLNEPGQEEEMEECSLSHSPLYYYSIYLPTHIYTDKQTHKRFRTDTSGTANYFKQLHYFNVATFHFFTLLKMSVCS